MINTVIAYDDNDFELSEYFENSHTDISDVLAANELITNISICGLECTKENINDTIRGINVEKFIFIAIAHGNEEVIAANGSPFVSFENYITFVNSLFYSCSCSSGQILGNELVQEGCLAFIGYFDTVFVIEEYYSIFYSCQNYGIKTFLSNDETIETSFNKMVNFYNEEIDRLVVGSTDDFLAASSLINNRDCLDILGCKTITRNDFIQ